MDKLTVAAALDRIIYGSPDTFSIDDAELLHNVIPVQKKSPFYVFFRMPKPGGSATGHAAGIGNIDLKEDSRDFKAEYGQDKVIRIGQYKLSRDKAGIEITRMMATEETDGHERALLTFTPTGEPTALKFQVPHEIVIPLIIFNIKMGVYRWTDWKFPVSGGVEAT